MMKTEGFSVLGEKLIAEGFSVLGEKLIAAGIDPAGNKLRMAIAEFLNNGGTIERAVAIFEDVAEQMRAAGQVELADKAKFDVPGSAQPNAGKGRVYVADKAKGNVPDPAPRSREDGQPPIADKANLRMPSSRGPDERVSNAGRILRDARKPGHARRGLASIAAVQEAVARSLFDTKLPDGRRLREVSWAECPTLARSYRRMSRVLMAVHSHAVPADPAATLDTIVSETQLNEIFSAVEKFNDIH